MKHLALQAALSEIRRSLNGSEQIDADDLAGHLGRPSAGQELVSADRSDTLVDEIGAFEPPPLGFDCVQHPSHRMGLFSGNISWPGSTGELGKDRSTCHLYGHGELKKSSPAFRAARAWPTGDWAKLASAFARFCSSFNAAAAGLTGVVHHSTPRFLLTCFESAHSNPRCCLLALEHKPRWRRP